MKRILIVAALLSLFCGQAFGSTFIYQTLNDLIKDSDGIVLGKVKKIRSAKTNNDIITYITLGEAQAIKGLINSNEITISVEGGIVGNEGLEVEGSPKFRPNERVILFIENNGASPIPFPGGPQGVFRVIRNNQNQEIVTDYLGNRITSIQKGGHILREKRFSEEVNIVGAPLFLNNSRARESQGGGGGQPNDGSSTQSIDKLNAQTDQANPFTLNQFLQSIRERLPSSNSRQRAVINSVQFGEPIRRVTQDQVMPGQQPGSNNVPTQPVEPKPIKRSDPSNLR